MTEVKIDPVTLAILKGRLEQIADEMDATLFRSAFTPPTPKIPTLVNTSTIRPTKDSSMMSKFPRHRCERPDITKHFPSF